MAIRDWFPDVSRVIGHQFWAPFGMYELHALTSKEYEGVGNGELRTGRGANGEIMISITKGSMARLSEGARGTNADMGDFRCVSNGDIANHFNKPEYAINRPSEFRNDPTGWLINVEIDRYANQRYQHWRNFPTKG